MNGGWGAMSPFGWVLMVALWVSVIAVVAWAVTRIFPGASQGSGSSDPMRPRAAEDDPQALLDRRLASGEVDPETYDQIRQRLEAARKGQGVRS